MLRVKNQQIAQAAYANGALKQLQGLQGLKIRDSFEIGKIVKKIHSALADYEAERGKIRTANTVNGAMDQTAFEADMVELLEIEVELDIQQVEFQTLLTAKESPTPGALADLDWLIKE